MEQTNRGQGSWRVLLLSVCERMLVTEAVRFCPSGNCLIVLNHMYQISDTTVVVPSGTFSSTPTGTTLPSRPTASSETAGELTLCRSSFSCHLHHCTASCVLHGITSINKCTLNVLSMCKSCPSIHCYLQKPVAMETIPQATYIPHIHNKQWN